MQPAGAGDDNKLTERVRAGDESALRALMLLYFNPLHRFVTSIVRDRSAAEDIVQEVFVRLWQSRHRLDPDKSIKTFLFTSARNHALNLIKHEKAQLRMIGSVASDMDTDSTESTDDEYFSFVESEQRQEQLNTAIECLPEKRRTVLALRFDQEMSYQEVGAVLGISAKAAQQLVIRTVGELRRALALHP